MFLRFCFPTLLQIVEDWFSGSGSEGSGLSSGLTAHLDLDLGSGLSSGFSSESSYGLSSEFDFRSTLGSGEVYSTGTRKDRFTVRHL